MDADETDHARGKYLPNLKPTGSFSEFPVTDAEH